MTAMRVTHTGPEHRPHVVPVFVEEVDVTIREGGTEATPEGRGASATNGVGARSGADAKELAQA
jgi:hypothetical protein